ncbi:MAG: hypothetical protein WC681_10860 [Sterolibacterium sp.]|jgi:hypothetical protein
MVNGGSSHKAARELGILSGRFSFFCGHRRVRAMASQRFGYEKQISQSLRAATDPARPGDVFMGNGGILITNLPFPGV